jgi:hypothetical protein
MSNDPNETQVDLKASLASEDRLALYIVGYLATHAHLSNYHIYDGMALTWMAKDIAAALREALPHVDVVEIQRLIYPDGQPK